jgi:pSer/pThr/pTyr-binding forkhead associated (FHA) protein
MSFRLSPLKKGSAPIIALYRPVLLVGRHIECDVRLDSPKISRRHCCIALAYDRVLIRDLGSRNGVRVNGRVVDESRLFYGDELAIGPILFRLDLEPDDDARPVARAPAPAASKAPPAVGSPQSDPAAGPSRALSDDDLVPLDDDD